MDDTIKQCVKYLEKNNGVSQSNSFIKMGMHFIKIFIGVDKKTILAEIFDSNKNFKSGLGYESYNEFTAEFLATYRFIIKEDFNVF
jgi:hypothetical protein